MRLLLAALATTLALPAGAATLPDSFDVGAGDRADGRSIWFRNLFSGPGAGGSDLFSISGGGFVQNGDGSAALTGTATSLDAGSIQFDVDVQLSLSPNPPGSRGGYCQFNGARDCVTGAPIMGGGAATGPQFDGLTAAEAQDRVDMWNFYTIDSATLTGVMGSLVDGLVLTLTDKTDGNHLPQLGLGANAFDQDNLGFSAWFNWVSNQGADATYGDYTFAGSGNGDFNMDVNNGGVLDIAPVPLPAGMWLMLGGLGALGAVRRSRRKA